MNDSITVIPWNGGHANVHHTATPTDPTKTPATKTARRNGRTISRDGRYWYIRDNGRYGRRWHVKEMATGQFVYADDDKLELGFLTLTDAAEFTYARDHAGLCSDCGEAAGPDCACTRDPHDNRIDEPTNYDR